MADLYPEEIAVVQAARFLRFAEPGDYQAIRDLQDAVDRLEERYGGDLKNIMCVNPDCDANRRVRRWRTGQSRVCLLCGHQRVDCPDDL